MEFVRSLKALADPQRLRILAAVAEEELTVGEVQEIIESAQSSVSRNLAILRAAGFVQDRREGTSVYFSARHDMPESARDIFRSLEERLAALPEVKQDQVRLAACRRRRLQRSKSYFESVAGDWDRIRKSYFDDRITSLAIEKLLPRDLVVADIGCGTGSLSFELARFARKVIAIDLSNEMLRRARAVASERAIQKIEFRKGDALKIPLEPASVDAGFSVMVLHFVPDPERAIAEMCRIVRPGGSVILVDLVQHQQGWMREEMAHQWLGFDRASIEKWFHAGGAKSVDYDLTGSFAGERLARNGNRPVEIFVGRATIRGKADRKKKTRGHD